MQSNSQNQNGIHIKPFWAITITAVVALVLGGVIYFYTQDNERLDDIYSISFTSPIQIHKQVKNPAVKPLVKPAANSTTTK
jgi:hypothetical protein